MKIARQEVARKLLDYLQHHITLAELVNWAELAIMEGDFEEDFGDLRDIVARLGLADVRAFGLTWEDCESLLSRLGYRAQVTVAKV